MKLFSSKSVKYLGIYLQEHLSGSAHVIILLPKLRRANGMLSKIRQYTSAEQVKSIYHAVFASRMTYRCQIWGQSFNNTHINKIQTLQNNALIIITFCPDFRDHATHAAQNNLNIKSDLYKISIYIQCIYTYIHNAII